MDEDADPAAGEDEDADPAAGENADPATDEHADVADLFPNRDADGPPVSRRGFVAGSAALGAAATAGCASGGDGGGSGPGTGTGAGTPGAETATPEQRDAVVVFNTGDMTVSVVDAAEQAVVETTHVGFTSTFPSNQYAPGLVDSAADSVWGNVDRGVRALGATALEERARIETGSGANWQELTPDGRHLLVSAREPAHTQFKIDADPESASFGETLAELDRTDEGGRGDNDGPGPCDITVGPDGEYAFVPDLYGDTLTVIDVETFGIETQVDVDPLDGSGGGDGGGGEGGGAPQPWMGTVDPQGERLLVEHRTGIETVWDVSDPTAPVELARFGSADGLGEGPLTSEISADGSTGYVFTRGSEDVTVVDLDALEVSGRIDLGGSAYTGTWDPAREFLYVPVRSENVVQVVDDATGEITATLDVGERPYGATATGVVPDPESTGTATAAASKLGLDGEGTAYCIGECACGHEL